VFRAALILMILLCSDFFIQVIRLTVSMLLQHLRAAEPAVEAVISFNLVDLALDAPENAFIDIIRAFSAINRTANPDDPRLSNNMVHVQP
jgi:phosphatidylinositol 4-kinase